MKATIAVLIALLTTTALAACGDDDSSSDSGPAVAATTGVIADITEQVAGDDAEVIQVIPDSASPHDFSLSAADRAEIEDSVLLVYNGADLEAGIPIDEIDVDSYAVAEHVGELLPFEEEGEHEHAEEEEAHADEELGDEHGGGDPHVWMDPTRIAEALPSLADAMAEADPEHADGYRRRATEYAQQLDALDEDLQADLAAIAPEDRELVTSHDALGYFANRYGFEVVATPFPASGPEAEPSAQSIQEVEHVIEETGVPAVFAEESDDPQILEQIADRTGVEVVDGLLVESPGDAGSYIEMLVVDARLIAGALAPSGGGQ